MTVEPTDGARLGAPGAGRRAGPDGRGRLRRGDRWRRGDRRGHGPGRRHPRAERRAGRGDRLRRRDLQPLQQTHPRRPALPRAAQLRPGPRGPPGAEPALDRARPPPRPAGVVPLPAPAQVLGAVLRRDRGAAVRHHGRGPGPAARSPATSDKNTVYDTYLHHLPDSNRPGSSKTRRLSNGTPPRHPRPPGPHPRAVCRRRRP